MATKGDIAELKAELSSAIASVRVEVAELKADIRLLKWVMGLIVLLNAGVLAALIRLLAS